MKRPTTALVTGGAGLIGSHIVDAALALVVFEESGHMPFIEEQAVFVTAVRRFIGA